MVDGGGDVAVAERVRDSVERLRSDVPGRRRFGAIVLLSLHAEREARIGIVALRVALNDDDALVRIAAAEALGLFGDSLPEALRTLEAHVCDAEDQIAVKAIDALGHIGPAAERCLSSVLARLDAESVFVRRAAVQALRTIKTPASMIAPAVIEKLLDQDSNVRRVAANTLVALGPAAVPHLLDGLRHGRQAIRRSVIEVLRRIARVPDDCASAFIESLRDVEEWSGSSGIVVKLFAENPRIVALTWLGPHPFSTVLTIEDPELRRLAFRTLRGYRIEEARLPTLLSVLDDPDDEIRSEAALALWLVCDANPRLWAEIGANRLLRSLDDVRREVRGWAIAGVRAIGDRQFGARLRALVDDHESAADAALTLAELGEPEPLVHIIESRLSSAATSRGSSILLRRLGERSLDDHPALRARVIARLLAALSEPREDRARVAQSLATWSPQDAVRLELLSDPDPEVRLATAGGLRAAGSAAAVGVDHLRAALLDANEDVQWEAARALRDVAGETGPIVARLLPLLDGLVYACKDREIWNGEPTFEGLRSVWPGFVNELSSIAREDASLLAKIAERIEEVFGIGPLNACRVHWEVTRRADVVVPVLSEDLRLVGWTWPRPIAAMELLSRMGAEAATAVPSIVHQLKDDYWIYRLYAVQALGCIGPAAETALPRLLSALDDRESEEVREAAAVAIGRIRPDLAGAIPALVDVLDNDHARRSLVTALAFRPDGVARYVEALWRRMSPSVESFQTKENP